MQYRNMGRTGLKVSEVCLGTMTFGHGTDERASEEIVELAFDSGVNFFDTANTYGDGASEVLLGNALKGRRRDAVVATKVFNPFGPGPNDSGMSRVHIMNAVEDSLRRLQTDYLDLYYIHHVDTQTPLEEMLRALDDLVRQGKVRYLGLCNVTGWQLGKVYEQITSANPRLLKKYNYRVVWADTAKGPTSLRVENYAHGSDAALDSWVVLERKEGGAGGAE